ncbi:hypothetical protein M422DRAFT_263517 [Sphaerobolus stellatus SS14]|uniref:F-box domain-containing protein n=1 Tax=Sphaerobolus stellatus (strain SS14) TaxID=990650 RepID=A0A0C9UYL7_SPHS4|nr:hypothetical protein M422DRAFT_263517 [Sphaerobolus stellatus SS14]
MPLLLEFSIELIDAILFEMDRPSDLLSLSLACRALYHRIIPDQLLFRHVSEKIGNPALWDHLLEYPSKAKRIRILLLNHGYRSSLSQVLQLPLAGGHSDWNKNQNTEFDRVLKAITSMDHLERLQFSPQEEHIPRFLSWLANGGTQAKRLSISWTRFRQQYNELSTYRISNPALSLTHISLTVEMFQFEQQHIANWENLLIHQCPKLVHLAVGNHGMTNASFPNLLKGHWRNLSTLCLQGILGLGAGRQTGNPDMATFLRRHPKLERISIKPWSNDSCVRILNAPALLHPTDISEDMLPSLKFCILGKSAQRLLPFLSTKNLIGLVAQGSPDVFAHLRNIPSLKYLGMRLSLTDIPKLVPNLLDITRLDLDFDILRIPAPDYDAFLEYVIQPLSQIRTLTHLRLSLNRVDFISTQSKRSFRSNENDYQARIYKRVCGADTTSAFEVLSNASGRYPDMVPMEEMLGFWNGR